VTAGGPAIRRRSAFADRLHEFPDLVLSDGAEFRRRGAWHDFFRGRIGPAFDGRVILEVGCNDAALLTRVAAKYPATAFIGIDWKCRALHAGAGRIAAARLRNVALLHGRGQDVGRLFADGELHEVWLFHPDPCDKPRELRNRLVTEPFLLDVHAVLCDGGTFVLKTDHPGYYQWALALLRPPESAGLENVSAPRQAIIDRFEVTTNSADFWNDDDALALSTDRCFAGETTTFERRFTRKRLPIHYLELKKRPPVAGSGRDRPIDPQMMQADAD
jgi:tRNA G46 methylase TrmB